jgi:hypothetical protein
MASPDFTSLPDFRSTRAASPLVAMLQEELRNQRVFLSADEEAALTRPLSDEDEDDLALDRVKRRRSWLQPVLRNRFICDGRPVALWRDFIVAEEAAAGGEPTIISSLAMGVLEWTARTGDRGAMFGGFAAKALAAIAVVLFFVGAYGWAHGAAGAGAAFVVVALVAFVGGRLMGGFAARRTASLTEQLLASPAEFDDV